MTSEYVLVGATLVNTAPLPKPKKPDPTLGYVLIFIVGLVLACALIWMGWQSLKRAADPYASLEHAIQYGRIAASAIEQATDLPPNRSEPRVHVRRITIGSVTGWPRASRRGMSVNVPLASSSPMARTVIWSRAI